MVEGKEEQAHRDEHVARGLTEDNAKRGLGGVGLAERGVDAAAAPHSMEGPPSSVKVGE